MKAAFVTLLVLALVATIGLPLYLGPDDLSDCTKPSDGSCKAADAIIVVSGGDTRARTAEGIRMYKDGWAPLLIFSGAAKDPDSPSNAESMREQAVESDVSRDSIMIEEFAANTEENATNTASIIESHGIKRIILVTSAYHQRRTSIEFSKKLGADVAIINHPVKNDNQWSQW